MTRRLNPQGFWENHPGVTEYDLRRAAARTQAEADCRAAGVAVIADNQLRDACDAAMHRLQAIGLEPSESWATLHRLLERPLPSTPLLDRPALLKTLAELPRLGDLI